MEFTAEIRYEQVGQRGVEQAKTVKKAHMIIDTENKLVSLVMPPMKAEQRKYNSNAQKLIMLSKCYPL